jgi:hypothetical protein
MIVGDCHPCVQATLAGWPRLVNADVADFHQIYVFTRAAHRAALHLPLFAVVVRVCLLDGPEGRDGVAEDVKKERNEDWLQWSTRIPRKQLCCQPVINAAFALEVRDKPQASHMITVT